MAISELIEELISASGPSRDLDTKIAFVTRFRTNNPGASEIPCFTGSLDAANELARKVAPASAGGTAWLADGTGTSKLDDDEPTFGANQAIALCIAAIRRMEANEALKGEVLKKSGQNYRMLFKKSEPPSNILLVVLSPYSGFMMVKRDFHCHTLYIHEQVNSYYTFQTDLFAQDVRDFAIKLGVTEVVFLGSSKAGYGALLAGRLFDPDGGNLTARSVAFAPVTRVYPLDKPLPFKTYPAFLQLIEQRPFVRASTQRLGLPPSRAAHSSYREKIVFGEFCDYDREEIEYLAGVTEEPETFMSVATVPASTHNVISLIAADKSSLERFTEAVLMSARRDLELPWYEKENEQFLGEAPAIFEAIKHVSLDDILGIRTAVISRPEAEISQPTNSQPTSSRKRQGLRRLFRK